MDAGIIGMWHGHIAEQRQRAIFGKQSRQFWQWARVVARARPLPRRKLRRITTGKIDKCAFEAFFHDV